MRKTIVVSALALTVGITTPAPAQACCGDGAIVAAAIAAAATAMTTVITSAVGEAAIGLAGTIERQVISFSRLVDAKTAQDVDIKQREMQVQIEMSARPTLNECRSATLGAQAQSASQIAARVSRYEVDKALELGLVSSERTGDVGRIVNAHLERYAGPQDARLGYNQKISTFANADINATSLFDGAGNVDRGLTQSKDDQVAARRFVENALWPFKTPSLSADVARTKSGREYHAAQLAEAAAMSMPVHAVTTIMGDRVPVAGLGAAFSKIYSTIGVAQPNLDAGVSVAELMRFEAVRRHANPQWYVDVAAMQTANQISKEQLYISALIAYQNQRAYEQGERLTAVLSQVAAVSVREHFKTQIQTAGVAAYNSSNGAK